MPTTKPRAKVTLEPSWLSVIWSTFPGDDLSAKLRWCIHEEIKRDGACPDGCSVCAASLTDSLFSEED